MKIKKITNSQRFYRDCMGKGSQQDQSFYEIFINLAKRKPAPPPRKPNIDYWRVL